MHFIGRLLGRHAFHLDFNPCQVRIIICMDIWNAIFTPQWCTNNANQCVVYDNTAATIIYEKNMEKQIIIVNNQKFKLNGIQNNKNENESKLHLQIPVPLVFVVQIIVWSKSELIWIQVGSFSSANNGLSVARQSFAPRMVVRWNCKLSGLDDRSMDVFGSYKDN